MTWFISKPTSAEDSDTPQVMVMSLPHFMRSSYTDHLTRPRSPIHTNGPARRRRHFDSPAGATTSTPGRSTKAAPTTGINA